MVLWGDGWLCDVVVPELNLSKHHKRLGEFGDQQLVAVVFEGDTNAPAVFASKFQDLRCLGLACMITLIPRGPSGVVL